MSTDIKVLLLEKADEAGIPLSADAAERMAAFHALLLAKNKEMNLTAITGADEAVEKHYLDALRLSVCLPKEGSFAALDVGSGAGFPGMPLAIFYPDAQWTLLDATGKRCDFLRAAATDLGLSNVRVLCGRAEELGRDVQHRETYDLVTARAVAPLATLSELCLPFAKVGGRFAAYKGEQADAELAAAQTALSTCGGVLAETVSYRTQGAARAILLFQKTEATPEKYPRRNGMPAKRPIANEDLSVE